MSYARMALLIGCGILGSTLLAGCGGHAAPSQAHGSAPSASTPASPALGSPSSTGAVTAQDFPRVIQSAMNQIPSKIVADVIAPTILPTNQNSGFAVARAHVTQTKGATPGYSVQLSTRGGIKLVLFGATHEPSPAKASQAVQQDPNGQRVGGAIVGHLSLAQHLTATVRRPRGNAPGTEVLWHEAAWTIVVSNRFSAKVPTSVAKLTVSDLQGASLPEPQSQGAIYVDIHSGRSAAAEIIWQKGSTTYFVNVLTGTTDPVATAIQLAGSMKTYP